MSKGDAMNILKGACPYCNGDVYTGYKGGRVWKCIQGSHYLMPSNNLISLMSLIACQSCQCLFALRHPENFIAYCPRCGKETPNTRHPRWAGQLKKPSAEEVKEAKEIIESM